VGHVARLASKLGLENVSAGQIDRREIDQCVATWPLGFIAGC